MPRPQRCRKICNKPEFTVFFSDSEATEETVVLTVDEFEVIRIVDLERRTHEQCAEQMEISRSTVTEIYESARHKIASSLVNGFRLTISGGNYRVCDGRSQSCGEKHCRKKRHFKDIPDIREEDNIMRIAVTYENGNVFQHFGHTEQFKFYDIENGKVVSCAAADTNGSGHGALAGFLAANNVDVLICGGIGGGAKNALVQAGIKLYGGVSGSADDAVNALLAGNLGYNPDVRCNHHDGGEHSCGETGCGKHGCH